MDINGSPRTLRQPWHQTEMFNPNFRWCHLTSVPAAANICCFSAVSGIIWYRYWPCGSCWTGAEVHQQLSGDKKSIRFVNNKRRVYQFGEKVAPSHQLTRAASHCLRKPCQLCRHLRHTTVCTTIIAIYMPRGVGGERLSVFSQILLTSSRINAGQCQLVCNVPQSITYLSFLPPWPLLHS